MKSLCIEQLDGALCRGISREFSPGIHVVLSPSPASLQACDTAITSPEKPELFAILSGCMKPRRGKVLLRGRNPYGSPEIRSHIASLFPDELALPGSTLREQLRPLKLAPARELAIAQVAQRLRAVPHSASENLELDTAPLDAQPLALSIALTTNEPWLMLLDEPLRNLETSARSFVLEALLHLALDIPVVVFTASLSLAERLGGATLELYAGSIRCSPQATRLGCSVRATGIGLRAISAELSRRPTVRSLRLEVTYEGLEALTIETLELEPLLLDITSLALSFGVRLLSLQTTAEKV